jgi:hypothetical protein
MRVMKPKTIFIIRMIVLLTLIIISGLIVIFGSPQPI